MQHLPNFRSAKGQKKAKCGQWSSRSVCKWTNSDQELHCPLIGQQHVLILAANIDIVPDLELHCQQVAQPSDLQMAAHSRNLRRQWTACILINTMYV